MLRNQPKPPKPLPRKRFFNPMSASIKLDRTDESLQIISDNVFLIKDIVCQNDVCFMFRVNDTTIFLRDITLHMRMQSNLFVSTIIIIILSALSAFFI